MSIKRNVATTLKNVLKIRFGHIEESQQNLWSPSKGYNYLKAHPLASSALTDADDFAPIARKDFPWTPTRKTNER